LDLASRSTDKAEAHVDADVRGHVEKRSIENLLYEVSWKHFGTNLQINCAAVNLSTIVIVPPHVGQTQDETARAISVERITGAIPKRCRQRSSEEDRWKLAMKPKWPRQRVRSSRHLGQVLRKDDLRIPPRKSPSV
jgi:hypothetical protein